MLVEFKNIRNVKLLPEDPPAYLCDLDLKLPDEDWEEVEYCARPNGGGICDDVIAAIQRGEFEGTITDGSPTVEQYWDDVRAKRDELLIESDIEVLPDRWEAMTPEERTAWTAYRQALRDIPQSHSEPLDIDWPTPPAQVPA